MYQQFQVGKHFRRETFPRPIPAVVCAFLWNVPLPLALEEPCGYCGYYFCSPYCASGRLLGQFPVPPMPGYWQQPGPSLAQQNHIGFRKAETLWHQPLQFRVLLLERGLSEKWASMSYRGKTFRDIVETWSAAIAAFWVWWVWRQLWLRAQGPLSCTSRILIALLFL